MFKQYGVGADLQYLARRVTEIVNSHYPVSWESQKLIDNAKSSVQIDSRGGGDVAQTVSIKVQEYEMNATQVNQNIVRYLTLKMTNLAKSDENYVRCWCIDKNLYAYPACESMIILKPYRIETILYRTSQRCLWGEAGEVPAATSEEFVHMSQKIEREIKARLKP